MKTRRWKADRKKTTAILWDRFTECCLLRAFQRLSFKHDRSKKNRTFSASFFRQANVVWANVVFELILLLCVIEILDRPQQYRRAALLTSATFSIIIQIIDLHSFFDMWVNCIVRFDQHAPNNRQARRTLLAYNFIFVIAVSFLHAIAISL